MLLEWSLTVVSVVGYTKSTMKLTKI